MNKGVQLVFLTAIISGFSIFINKFGVDISNPFIFVLLKNGIVALSLLSLLLFFREFEAIKKLGKKDWFKLGTIGLIGGSIPFLLFFKGLQLTTSAKAAFIHKTMFIFVFGLAYIFLKEKFNWKVGIAGCLLVIGNLLLLKFTWQPFNIGDLMILAATLLWAGENILSKKVLKTIPSNVVGFSRMFFGSLFIMIFLMATGSYKGLFTLTITQIVWALIPSLFLFLYVLMWYSGLKRIPATLATAILLIGSPITTILNMLYTGTMISLQQSIGILMLVFGVIVFSNSLEYKVNSKWMASS